MSTDENTPLFFSHPLPSASVSSGFASPCYHRSHSPSPSLPLDDSKESFLLSTLVRENQLHEWRISELEREMVGLRERALPFGAFFICSRKRRSGAFHPPLLLPHFLRFQVSPRMLPFFFFGADTTSGTPANGTSLHELDALVERNKQLRLLWMQKKAEASHFLPCASLHHHSSLPCFANFAKGLFCRHVGPLVTKCG